MMKKVISICLAVLMCFVLASCAGGGEEATTSDANSFLNSAPILGVEIKNENEAGFFALTKNGTYTWTRTLENGETEETIYDGIFCLESENLCTFNREQTEGSIKLKFTGDVESYKIYCAEKSEILADKKEIINEKYLTDSTSDTILFPESGEYYYVVNVKYAQGEVPYGFFLAE